MGFALATLNIPVTVNTAGFVQGMDLVRATARDRMGASASSVQDFGAQVTATAAQTDHAAQSIRRSTAAVQASASADLGGAAADARDLQDSMASAARELQRAADAMAAANKKIGDSATESAKNVQKIADAANDVNFDGMGDKLKDEVHKGFGDAQVEAEGWGEKIGSFVKRELLIVGIAVAAGLAVGTVGALFAAYKAIGFGVGLLTGESYKSKNIDALIAINDKVKELQGELHIGAVEAGALLDALDRLGVPKGDFVSVYTAAAEAIGKNGDELDRLGVKYKDADGKLLTQQQFLENAKTVLEQYTVGWDRNQAAAAIGVGSYEKVTAALKVTREEQQASLDRLNDFNLGIGPETQAAVTAYQTAMREFAHEAELTSQSLKRAIADQIMPILTQLAEFFKDGFPTAVAAFRYSMATITSLFYGLKTSAYLAAESIVGSISSIGSIVAALGIAAARVVSGDFTGAKQALVDGWTDAKTRLGQIGDNIVAQARQNAAAMRLAWGFDDRSSIPGNAPAGKPWNPAPAKPDDAKTVVDPYDALIKSIQEKAAAQAIDTDATNHATEAQKALAKYLEDLDKGYIQFNATKEKTLFLALGALQVGERERRDSEARRAQLLADGTAIDEYNKSVSAQIGKLQEEADTYHLTDIAKQRLAATHEVERAALANLFKTHADENGNLVTELKLSPEATAQILLRMDADKKAAATLVEKIAVQKLSLQYDQEIAQLRIDSTVYFDQSTRAIALLELEAQKRRDVIASLQEDSDERRKLLDQYQQWYSLMQDKIAADKFMSIWTQVDQIAQQTFTNIFEGGKSAFTKLRDTLKSTLLDLLYQMTVKKWIFNVVAQVSGSGTTINSLSSGIGNSLFSGGLNSLASASPGGFVDSALSLFGGGTGIAGSAASAAEIAATGEATSTALAAAGASAGEAAAAGTALAGSMAEAGAAASTLGAGMSAALAAIPVVGWIAAAAAVLYSVFGSKGGGPKTSSGFGAGVDLTQGDGSAAQSIAQNIQAQYASLATSLGVTDTVLQNLGVFFAKDPQGTAQTQLDIHGGDFSRIATDGGFENVGRSDTDFEAAVAQASAQLLLKNLQESVQGPIGDYLRSFDITTASTAAMGQALQVAKDVSTFDKAVTSLGPRFQMLSQLSIQDTEALVQMAGGMQNLLNELGNFYNDFATDAEKQQRLAAAIASTLTSGGLAYSAQQVLDLTREQYAALVDQAMNAGVAGDRATATLLSVEQAFNQLHPAAAQAASAISTVTDTLAAAAAALQAAFATAKSATDTAFNQIKAAVDAQKAIVNAQIAATQTTISNLKSIFTLLDQQVRQLYGNVSSTAAMQAAQGQAVIDEALKSGALPDQQALQNAISAVTASVDSTVYATQFEADRAKLVLAGQLLTLQNMTSKQLTVANGQLTAEQQQLAALDQVVASAQQQLDALRGIDDSVKSLDQAVKDFQAAVLAEQQAKNAVSGAQSVAGSTIGAAGTFAPGFDASGGFATADGSTYVTAARVAQIEATNTGISNLENSYFAKYGQYIGGALFGTIPDEVRDWSADDVASWLAANAPAMASGTNYVPQDMLAFIHKGEAVVPSPYNPAHAGTLDMRSLAVARMPSSVGSAARDARLEQAVSALAGEVKALNKNMRTNNRHASETAAILGNKRAPVLMESA